MEYKLNVCIEMLNYAFRETDLRASETKKALAVFFDKETIEQATAILSGKQLNRGAGNARRWQAPRMAKEKPKC